MTASPGELRALLAKATSLPWSGQASDDYVIEAAAYPKEYGGRFPEDSTGFYLAQVGNHPADYGEANRDLIVAAVNALPALLDRLQAQASTIEALAEGWRGLDCECDSYHGYTCKRCALLSSIPEAAAGGGE